MLSPARLPRPDPELSLEQQYALLVVSEAQLHQLMGRQAMRQVNRRLLSAGEPYAPAPRPTRRAIGAMVALIALGMAAGAWLWAPRPALAAVLPWTKVPAPALLTGASFSVAVASARSADAAGDLIGRLHGMGLPAYASTRHVTGSERALSAQMYQVMVGPYVSLDEAEGMQQRLAAAGFARPRISVDEALRHAPRRESPAGAMIDDPGVLLVSASGRLSLVLELAEEPRQVSTRRMGDTAVELEIGPIVGPVPAREWTAPPGAHLIRGLSIEEVRSAGETRHLLARIALPEFSRANSRVEGRRVYVDLTWPQVAAEVVPAARRTAPAPIARTAPHDPAADPPAPSPGTSIEPLMTAIDRFEEFAPFLLSAATSPSPEVLGALDSTVASLAHSLQGMRVPRDAAAGHGILISATDAARRALDPAFGGDRLAQAHQAVGLFESGKTQVSVMQAAR